MQDSLKRKNASLIRRVIRRREGPQARRQSTRLPMRSLEGAGDQWPVRVEYPQTRRREPFDRALTENDLGASIASACVDGQPLVCESEEVREKRLERLPEGSCLRSIHVGRALEARREAPDPLDERVSGADRAEVKPQERRNRGENQKSENADHDPSAQVVHKIPFARVFPL